MMFIHCIEMVIASDNVHSKGWSHSDVDISCDYFDIKLALPYL